MITRDDRPIMVAAPECKYRERRGLENYCNCPKLIFPDGNNQISLGMCLNCAFSDKSLEAKKEREQLRPRKKLFGDIVETALSSVGITEDRVSEWLGQPCGCKERKEKLNRLDAWARRVASGKLADAKNYLEKIIGSDTKDGDETGNDD